MEAISHACSQRDSLQNALYGFLSGRENLVWSMLLSHVFCLAAGHQCLGCGADRFYQDRQFHQDSPEYSLPLPIVRVMGYSAMLRLHRLVCCSHFGLHWDSQRGLADVLGSYSRAGLTQHPCLLVTEALVPALVAADRVVAFSIGLS